jgi:tetratricopeptide (TPR) repeat protein
MENEQENSNVKISISKEQVKRVKVAVIVLLFAMPLIYLFYKTNGLPENTVGESDSITQPATADLSVLEKAVAENPNYDNLINLSMAYINNQMPGKSIDHLNKATELNPNSAIAYNNLGVAYTMLQQYQNGIDACAKALQIDSSFQLAKNNLAWATGEKNKVLAAIEMQQAVPENKRDVAFYSDHGLNYFRIGDYGKSIEAWNRIFEIDVKNTGALNSIGTAFMMKRQVDDAIALFKKAVELEPENQLAKNNLAWALGEKEKMKLN